MVKLHLDAPVDCALVARLVRHLERLPHTARCVVYPGGNVTIEDGTGRRGRFESVADLLAWLDAGMPHEGAERLAPRANVAGAR
jgi:hypothetical protein